MIYFSRSAWCRGRIQQSTPSELGMLTRYSHLRRASSWRGPPFGGPHFVIKRLEDGINDVEELPPDVAEIMCWDLCKGEEVTEEDFNIG